MWTIGFIALALLSIVNIAGIMKYGVNRIRYVAGALISLAVVLGFFGIGGLILIAALSIAIGHYARNFVLSFVE